jgi:ribosome biogenesis GTPase A
MYQKRKMRQEKKNNSQESFAKVRLNWYPGHMAKTKKQITEDLKLIDIVVELLDSRIPISSRNPDIFEITKNKDKIIVLNKSDLADSKQNELWVKKFKEQGITAIIADCNSGYGINEILRAIEKTKQKEMEEFAQKGRIGRKIRVMVLRNSKCSESLLL